MGDLDLIKNVLAAMPYAAKLGVTAQLDDDGRLVCTMPFHENHIGNAAITRFAWRQPRQLFGNHRDFAIGTRTGSHSAS